jgi:hypothetical protein
MILTFSGLTTQVLRAIDEASNTSTTRTLVQDFLNQAQEYRLTQYPWPFMLWDSVETFATTAGTQTYPLHQEFHRAAYFYNRTKKAFLTETPMRSLENEQLQLTSDDPPTDSINFALWGRTQVKAQPTSASTVSISSSSASDNSSTYNLYVRGVNSSGVVVTDTITPNGTTPVASTSTFVKILTVTKAAAWNGRLTMTSNSAAVTNLTLEAAEYGRSYQQLHFLGAPEACTIEYRFYRQPIVMVNDYDIPELPPPHAQILVYDALLMIGAYNTDVDQKALTLWREERHKREVALEQSFSEAQSVGASPTFVRTIHEDSGFPTIFRS